jgi:hypothetical protein
MASTFQLKPYTDSTWLWGSAAMAAASATSYMAAGLIGVNPIAAAGFTALHCVADYLITEVATKALEHLNRKTPPHSVAFFRFTIVTASAIAAYFISPYVLSHSIKKAQALGLTATVVGVAGLIPVAIVVIDTVRSLLDSCLGECVKSINKTRAKLNA